MRQVGRQIDRWSMPVVSAKLNIGWRPVAPETGRNPTIDADHDHTQESCEAAHIGASYFALIRALQTFLCFNRTEICMKRLMISALVTIALFAVATGMRRSHSLSSDSLFGTAAMPTLQELQSAASAKKLPTEDFQDGSLVYPRETKH